MGFGKRDEGLRGRTRHHMRDRSAPKAAPLAEGTAEGTLLTPGLAGEGPRATGTPGRALPKRL